VVTEIINSTAIAIPILCKKSTAVSLAIWNVESIAIDIATVLPVVFQICF